MAASTHTVVTRLLPWAALVVMTVMFFVQIRARQCAQRDAEKAKDDLNVLRADRAMGLAPAPLAPLPASRAEAAAVAEPAREDDDGELAALHRELKKARQELADAESARLARLVEAERSEALRMTEAARADALETQLGAESAAGAARVAALEDRLAEAKALLERRESPVRRWIALARSGTPEAVGVVRVEAAKATADDLAELRALWSETRATEGPETIASVLAPMPVSPASAALAADILLAVTSPRVATATRAALGPHALHVDAVARVLTEGSNELREDVVLAAKGTTWSDAAEARLSAAVDTLLRSQDAHTVEVGINAIARLGLRGQAAALLPFLTHDAAAVRIAAVYALLATSDRASAVRTLQPIVLGLLEDKEPDVRLAGLFLAQELAGEKQSLAFGSSEEALAKEMERLRKKLAAMARE